MIDVRELEESNFQKIYLAHPMLCYKRKSFSTNIFFFKILWNRSAQKWYHCEYVQVGAIFCVCVKGQSTNLFLCEIPTQQRSTAAVSFRFFSRVYNDRFALISPYFSNHMPLKYFTNIVNCQNHLQNQYMFSISSSKGKI